VSRHHLNAVELWKRTGWGRSWRALALAPLLCAMSAVLVGCGSAATTGGQTPAVTAVGYARSLFSGDYTAAGRYVAASERAPILALMARLGPKSVRSYNLRAGKTIVSGTNATVELTGTICSSGGITALPTNAQSSGHCVTNGDPQSSNPIFLVHLAREAGGRWFVVFPVPRRSATPIPQSTTTSQTLSGQSGTSQK
jgi:hypothetical protein